MKKTLLTILFCLSQSAFADVTISPAGSIEVNASVSASVLSGNISSIDAKTPANTSADLFGRLRVSNPVTLMSIQNQYDRSPLLFEEWTAGTGAFSTLSNASSVQYSTGGTASGAYAYRQTRSYIRYQPGKNQEIILSRTLGALKTNVRQRFGIFDQNNGIFIEQDGVNLKMVVRSNVTGSPIDTAVNQSEWSDCKSNGSGPSGFALDTSKENIYFINFEWLGSGDVVFGVYNGRKPVICNIMAYSNTAALPYMSTPNLPIRGEIENIGTAASATTMLEICTTAISSGGSNEPFSYGFGANDGITGVSVTTSKRAVLSIRPKATFGGLVNRSQIELLTYNLNTVAQNVQCDLIYNPTFTGTPTWTSADSNSTVEYSIHNDAAAGAYTGGIPISSFYVYSGTGQTAGTTAENFEFTYPLTLDHAGLNPIAMSLVCQSFTGTATVWSDFNWSEER